MLIPALEVLDYEVNGFGPPLAEYERIIQTIRAAITRRVNAERRPIGSAQPVIL
jgi:hypothetical protein